MLNMNNQPDRCKLLLLTIKFDNDRTKFNQSYKDVFKDEYQSDYKWLIDGGYIRLVNNKTVLTAKAEELFIPNLDFLELANKMKLLFPAGKKSGNYYWRSNAPEVAIKLKKLFKKFPHLEEQEILNATERYVNSFSDLDRDSSMSLLTYFIEKNGRSIILEFIENKEITGQTARPKRSLN